jgi:O-methyltransferase involved in polyketide biosynthesis
MVSDQDDELNVYVPEPYRVDYLLRDGKDVYQADSELARKILEWFPTARTAVAVREQFVARATRYLATNVGMHQYLMLGAGYEPTLYYDADVLGSPRMVFVAGDVVVHTHARALWSHHARWVRGDLAHAEEVLGEDDVRWGLDFARPVTVVLSSALEYVTDDVALEGVRVLVDALVPGSYVVACHVTLDLDAEAMTGVEDAYRDWGIPYRPRTRSEFEALFGGLELLEPGIVPPHRWWPDGPDGPRDEEINMWAAVARKP